MIIPFIPTFSMALVAGILLFRIYKRSISATLAILTFAISSNLRFYHFEELENYALIVGVVVLFVRAMIKPDNDTFRVKPYKKGVERRKRHA